MAKGGVSHDATRARVAWLLAHQSQWIGYGDFDARSKTIVEAMKLDGLISPTTIWQDVDLSGLVNAARRLRREAAAKVA